MNLLIALPAASLIVICLLYTQTSQIDLPLLLLAVPIYALSYEILISD